MSTSTYTKLLVVSMTLMMSTGVKAIHPSGPLICGSAPADMPHIYGINTNYTCDKQTSNQTTTKPQKMQLFVYRRNLVEWASTAYQCSKYTQTVTTHISFFTDVKTKTTSTQQNYAKHNQCGIQLLLQGSRVYSRTVLRDRGPSL